MHCFTMVIVMMELMVWKTIFRDHHGRRLVAKIQWWFYDALLLSYDSPLVQWPTSRNCSNEKKDNDYRYIIWKLKSSQYKIVGHCSLMLFHPQRKRTAQLVGFLPSTKVVSKLTSHTLKLSLFYTRRLSHFQIFTLSNSHKFHTFAFTHSQIFTPLYFHIFTVGLGYANIKSWFIFHRVVIDYRYR